MFGSVSLGLSFMLDELISELELPSCYKTNLIYARLERLKLLNMDLAIIAEVTEA